MTRPHCNLSRATAAALVAPAGAPINEPRRSRHDLPTTSSSSNATATGKGKLGSVLTAVKGVVSPRHLVEGETEIEVEATPEAILTPATTTISNHDEVTGEADEAAICEAFETEAVFPHPSSSSPATMVRQAEVEAVGTEGMVEEFLDGEEEEEEEVDEDDGDENENENAMLCRAHESALLKVAEAAAAEAAAAVTQKATNGDVGFAGQLNVEEREEEGKCMKVEESDPQTQSQQECCDSPPPIVAHVGWSLLNFHRNSCGTIIRLTGLSLKATPMRKVVRVTTFEEDGSRSTAGEQSVGLGASIATVATTTATSLIIPSEAKRSRLA